MSLSSDPLVPRQLGPPDLPPGPPLSARNRDKASVMGLTSPTGLVVGSIVGTGVFTMPAVLAGAGTIGPAAWPWATRARTGTSLAGSRVLLIESAAIFSAFSRKKPWDGSMAPTAMPEEARSG